MTPLARVIEIISLSRMAASLLDTYVGNRAGERIMGGQIRRGHTETMNAAIWLSDLRGFTALSDRLPAETVVDILNQYFDCQVAAIRNHGGEVLKYMGDGLLAVFPIDEYVGDEQQVCSRVLEAAHESRASVADMQYPIGDAVERFRFGVALHVGRILYGNIGGGNRLDFTCIGPAVNLAARLEKIASQTQAHRRGVGRVCRHLPGRVERSRRVSGRGLFKGRARLRPGRRNVGGVMPRSCGPTNKTFAPAQAVNEALTIFIHLLLIISRAGGCSRVDLGWIKRNLLPQLCR